MTRPNLSFALNKLSQFLKSPTRLQWQACKRILRYEKGTLDYELVFKLAAILSMEAYVYVDWVGNLSDRRLTNAFCVFSGGTLV